MHCTHCDLEVGFDACEFDVVANNYYPEKRLIEITIEIVRPCESCSSKLRVGNVTINHTVPEKYLVKHKYGDSVNPHNVVLDFEEPEEVDVRMPINGKPVRLLGAAVMMRLFCKSCDMDHKTPIYEAGDSETLPVNEFKDLV